MEEIKQQVRTQLQLASQQQLISTIVSRAFVALAFALALPVSLTADGFSQCLAGTPLQGDKVSL